jgi:hypothetical protein
MIAWIAFSLACKLAIRALRSTIWPPTAVDSVCSNSTFVPNRRIAARAGSNWLTGKR